MSDSTEVIFENIVTAIDEAIVSEVGADKEFNETTEQLLDDVQTMLKEALGLPEDHTI